MISGARQARPSRLRRIVSGAISRKLEAFVVPGPEVARACGLDLEAAGLRVTHTPRRASVLVVVGELPQDLRRAATVAYAQMPRPRAVLAAGPEDVSPLPGPDVRVEPAQEALSAGVAELRRLFVEGAFAAEVDEFRADALRTRTEYVCPMHPEVVQDEPGTCPECGMELVGREAAGEEIDEEPGSHGDHEHTEHGAEGDHEETHEETEHDGHDHHGHMDHGNMGFMSMIEMTQGTPRSSDGLQMEWVEAPFGPLFPGLPGGLTLTFTLDGDTVAVAEAGSSVGGRANELGGPVGTFADRLAGIDPLSPVCYWLLALRAVESAAGVSVDEATALARAGALEHERAASHLNWLASFAHLIGYPRLARRAGELQLALARADAAGVEDVRVGAGRLARRVERTPLLRYKLAGIGTLPDPLGAVGPVARAGGAATDARAGEGVYRSLGFEPVVREDNDALARLRVRLAEIRQSLDLAVEVGFEPPTGAPGGPLDGVSGSGTATVETPRGAAALTVVLEGGAVSSAELETPSGKHLALVSAVSEQREVADALVGVVSLDISPWEAAP